MEISNKKHRVSPKQSVPLCSGYAFKVDRIQQREVGWQTVVRVRRHASTGKRTSSYLNFCNALELLNVVAFSIAEIACHDTRAQKYYFTRRIIEFAPLL